MASINRKYKPYWDWEEFQNGMYKKDLNADLINDTVLFMKNSNLFFMYMKICVTEWENAMIHNLTNASKNRIAFIGQCACCYALGVNSECTKIAWKQLTHKEKNIANIKAKICLEDWILDYEK